MNTISTLSETNYSGYVTLGGGGAVMRSQSFAGNDDYLIKADVYGQKAGSPTGKIYAKIYAHRHNRRYKILASENNRKIAWH